MNEKLIFESETYAIRGAAHEVHKAMGCGFLEAVYQECMERELTRLGIPFVAQQKLQLYYKSEVLNHIYQPDFVCYGKIIVELKAVSALLPEHKAQLMNYLKASGLKLGLLINFGSYPKAQMLRVIN